MSEILLQLFLFTSKSVILVILILLLFSGLILIGSKGKAKAKGRITIKNLNRKQQEITETLLHEILDKTQLKQHMKKKKNLEKSKKKLEPHATKNIFVINFQGDIKASAVTGLREEISAILNVATSQDEVVVRLDSPGGMVHTYGLAAAQLLRIRQNHIPLTVVVDKVAASGGYLMACVANTIIAAPFAIIGSIGVIIQLPNFHRLLKSKNIDFEQLTAGSFKRTLTIFGENTEEGRNKLQQEIEAIHHSFKNLIHEYRPQLDMKTVATGEHWLGQKALELKLVDNIQTSDDYLHYQGQAAAIYEIKYEMKKSLSDKFSTFALTLLRSMENRLT